MRTLMTLCLLFAGQSSAPLAACAGAHIVDCTVDYPYFPHGLGWAQPAGYANVRLAERLSVKLCEGEVDRASARSFFFQRRVVRAAARGLKSFVLSCCGADFFWNVLLAS